jgi:hypothetical protein
MLASSSETSRMQTQQRRCAGAWQSSTVLWFSFLPRLLPWQAPSHFLHRKEYLMLS